MNLQEIYILVDQELKQVDMIVNESLYSKVDLIPTISQHLVSKGGKRLRPLLVLLSAKAVGYVGKAHITLAAVLELIHIATLLHDDVVDNSSLRRNCPTANKIWGNAAPILVGDFLYSKAFELMVQTKCFAVLEKLAHVTNKMAAGEVLQLTHQYNIHITEAECLEVIRAKTGQLFAAAAMQGSLLKNDSVDISETMYNYGLSFGIAFQLADDALDYTVQNEAFGKNQGDDLAEGKITFPLVYAIKNSNSEQRLQIEKAVQKNSADSLSTVMPIIEATHAIDYTYRISEHYAEKAIKYIDRLPASRYQNALRALSKFAVKRTH